MSERESLADTLARMPAKSHILVLDPDNRFGDYRIVDSLPEIIASLRLADAYLDEGPQRAATFEASVTYRLRRDERTAKQKREGGGG